MNAINSIRPKLNSFRPVVKFFSPIIQGVIVLLIIAVLGWGFRSYAKYEIIAYSVSTFDDRLKSLETELRAIKTRIEKVPLCQK